MNSQKIRLLAQMGLCTASLFIGQVVLSVLPNIEIVSLLVILFTLFYGKNVFFIIYSFVILEGFLYGFLMRPNKNCQNKYCRYKIRCFT